MQLLTTIVGCPGINAIVKILRVAVIVARVADLVLLTVGIASIIATCVCRRDVRCARWRLSQR